MTDRWHTVGSAGVIPPVDANDQLLGGHAVVAVGYDDGQQLLLIRNSWGAGWGADGYGWLPYDHLDHYGLQVATLEPIH